MRCNHGSARYQATDRQQMPLEEANVKRHATGDLLTRDTDAAGTPKRGKNLASSSSKNHSVSPPCHFTLFFPGHHGKLPSVQFIAVDGVIPRFVCQLNSTEPHLA
jgi:hypothetical protein